MPSPTPTTLTCEGDMNTLNRACELSCNPTDDLAILEPNVLTCGPAGILEYMNPYLSRRVPECTAGTPAVA